MRRVAGILEVGEGGAVDQVSREVEHCGVADVRDSAARQYGIMQRVKVVRMKVKMKMEVEGTEHSVKCEELSIIVFFTW